MKGGHLDRPELQARADRLIVHVLGPGFGESTVVLFPGGEVMVVDACTRAGANLPAALLDRFGIRKIDLLAITHPDLDHIRGVTELLEKYSPGRVWLYPSARSLRDLIVRWTSNGAEDPWRRKLWDLRSAHAVLDRFLKEGRAVREVMNGSLSWSPGGGAGCSVDVIAPTQYDQWEADKGIQSLIRVRSNRLEIDEKFADQLLGRRRPDDHPNLLSVALSLTWRSHRLLFAGDVENGEANGFSGWKGVIESLTADERLDLIRDVSLVKVAHHGSNGAFWEPAWRLHAKADGSSVAFVTPFSRCTPPLPSEQTLLRLRPLVSRLGITADVRGSFARAAKVGFQSIDAPPSDRREIILSAVLHETGEMSLYGSGLFARA